jgi:hypothetical protein
LVNTNLCVSLHRRKRRATPSSSIMAVLRRCVFAVKPFSSRALFPRVALRPAFSTTSTFTPASSTPAYTITEAPVASSTTPTIRRGWFVYRNIKGHTKKLNPLARQIVGLRAHEAMTQMAYAARKRGAVLKTAIERAVMNADFYNPNGASADQLTVEKVNRRQCGSMFEVSSHFWAGILFACFCIFCRSGPERT